MAIQIDAFELPTYREIPGVGLYLEQTVKYINECMTPLGCVEITSSMISNYVKKGYITRPIKKQYDADQIAALLFIAVAKLVLPMENIARMMNMPGEGLTVQQQYEQFRAELHAALQATFGLAESTPTPPERGSNAPAMLRSMVTAVAHVIYLNHCFETLSEPGSEA